VGKKLGIIIEGIILAIVTLASVSLSAQRVNTTYDRKYDFSKVKSFALSVQPWGDPTTEEYAKEILAKELRAKGWIQAPNESLADVLVVLKGDARDKKVEENFYNGGIQVPAGVSGPAGVSNTRVIEQRLGEGTVDVFDAKTHQLIFSSVARAGVSPEEKNNERLIKKGLEKAFKDFPPKPKG